MDPIAYTILGARETVDYFGRTATRIDDEAKRWVYRAGIVFLKHVRVHASGKSLGRGASGPWGGVHTARGNVARSWQIGAARTRGNEVEVPVGSGHPAARIQEYGGVVRAKGGALTVPINPMADRKTARDFDRSMTSIVKTPRGTFIVLNHPGRSTKSGESRGARSIFLYLLKKQVTLKPTHYVSNAINDARPEMDHELGRAVDASIKPETTH